MAEKTCLSPREARYTALVQQAPVAGPRPLDGLRLPKLASVAQVAAVAVNASGPCQLCFQVGRRECVVPVQSSGEDAPVITCASCRISNPTT
jgi:hypothetical protein